MAVDPIQQAAIMAMNGGNPFQQNILLMYHHPQLLANGQIIPGYYQQVILV